MPERSWTKPQQDAITAQGGSLLVSAAAGSGKTAVLVERAIRLICDNADPVPADRLLVVTFSNAAAAEMKQRIGARLSSMIAADPANIHLQRQQALVQGAQISTIHSFCLQLIRQNFQHLEVSPDFTLSDENEMEILEQDCARDCIEEYYERDETGAFAGLVELLSTSRDDRNLVNAVLKIYHFSRSHPFWEDWLDQKEQLYDTRLPVAETIWGKTVLRYATDSLRYCRQMMWDALTLVEGDEALQKGYREPFLSDIAQIDACLAVAQPGDWDQTVDRLAGFIFVRLGAVRGADQTKERVKATRDRCKKIIQNLAARHMNASAGEFQQDIACLRPQIAVLFDLVKTFGRRLWEVKAAKKRLDFSDLEHLTLQLLVDKEGDRYTRTEKAAEVAACYDMVMVDEYQDTNEVQDLIFTSVSNLQRNLFMVGDVKQSIYSFRQAMPEIFLRKKQVFFPYESGQYPAKINLDTNFRSRASVTQGVNYLFSLLMSTEIGDMEYGEEESLKCGAAYPEYPGAFPEFLLLERKEDSEEDPTLLEARAVAEKIEAMLREGYLVTAGEGMRPAVPKDFCILLRSHRNRAEVYVKELTRLGIPAWSGGSGGYLQAREISAVVSLLKALDNPLLDVELVAALLSPLFDFTDDDIARIRLIRRGTPFYTALLQAAEEGDSKAGRFLRLFAHLRVQAAVLPADRLLLELYDQTDALAVVRGMQSGETRTSNLQLLVEYAASYHRLGYKRLGGFVGFLNRLEERGRDLAPVGSPGVDSSANAVRVLSVHKSKGLEFPVVILADTMRKFNKADLRANTLLHSQYGFACVRREEETMRQFATVPMQAIRLESERTLLSEELRILYVALTRAREKIIISGFVKNKLQRYLANLSIPLQGDKLPSYAVREANCYADWILMALLHHQSAVELREAAGTDSDAVLEDNTPWRATIRTVSEVGQRVMAEEEITHTSAPDSQLLAHLQKRAAFAYSFQNQVRIPAKLAVSEVAKGERGLEYRFAARPKFLVTDGLTGAERGNALHKFMQFSDYQRAKSHLEQEIAQMQERGFLSAEESKSLSRARLRKFFQSALANRIFSSEKVLRELKFTAECGKDMLGDYIDGMDAAAKIVLQGVADCVFFEDGKSVIVDYKTDFVESPEQLIQLYQTQIKLYRRILSDNLSMPVSQCLLYSFHLGKQVEIL